MNIRWDLILASKRMHVRALGSSIFLVGGRLCAIVQIRAHRLALGHG
jgi:hypothetical protein